jgi:hypothetical protein
MPVVPFSTREAEAGESQVQGQPELHRPPPTKQELTVHVKPLHINILE